MSQPSLRERAYTTIAGDDRPNPSQHSPALRRQLRELLADRELHEAGNGLLVITPTKLLGLLEVSTVWARPTAFVLAELASPGARLWAVPTNPPLSKGDVQAAALDWVMANAPPSYSGRLLLSDADVVIGPRDMAQLDRDPYSGDLPIIRAITGSAQLLGTFSGPFAEIRSALPRVGQYVGWGFEDTHTLLDLVTKGAELHRFPWLDSYVIEHPPSWRNWPNSLEQGAAVRHNGQALLRHFGPEAFKSKGGREVLALFRAAGVLH